MRCPRCKKQQDILQYIPMRMNEEFVADTTPVYKCPSCRWIFAPAENLVIESLERQRNGHGSVREEKSHER